MSALLMGLPLAWLARAGRWRAWPAIVITATLLAIPGPLLGLTLSKLIQAPNWTWLNLLYDRSIFAPMMAQALRALPIVVIVLWYSLRTVPQKTLDAARLEGAGYWGQLWYVAMRQRRGAIAAAWLIALAIALGDLSASFLVLPPGFDILSRRIFEEVHYGVPGRIAGITLVTMLMTSAVVLTALCLIATTRRPGRQSTW